MAKRKPKPAAQLSLFTREQMPRAAPSPPPLPTAATVTEQLPDELIAAGWIIVWNTNRHADGWFYASNERLGQRTTEHIYVKHRGFKFTIRDIAKARTTPA